ncbi:MAG: CehA/McbA family metallohydrolase [Thermomicrobiales bacterium]|nr:CehA/McbA family metallohydrolase [Thermomicrobiales bacterium]
MVHQAYEALDIRSLGLRSAGTPDAGSSDQTVLLRGVPFLIDDTETQDTEIPPFRFGPGVRHQPVRIPIERAARTIIFGHVVTESDVPNGGPVGELVAEYVFAFADGTIQCVPIREVFEIGALPKKTTPKPSPMIYPEQWPSLVASRAFHAVPDQADHLHPRWSGSWTMAGRRRQEGILAFPERFHLWAWRNPGESEVVSVEIRPTQRNFEIAALTVGYVDEDPFEYNRPLPVRIEFGTDSHVDITEIEVEVDRGLASYVYPLPLTTSEEFLAGSSAGWGEPLNYEANPSYVMIAAAKSAEITLKRSGEAVARVPMADILDEEVITTPNGVSFRRVEEGRSWVHTTVFDEATGRPVPCRIHFRSSAGVPYQPHGHHDQLNTNISTWNFDIGGDVRLGQTTYACINGTCEGWLPHGDVIVEVVRGFEYEPIRERITISPGQKELKLSIRRWCDLASDRWFSGDTHVHFLSTQGAHVEASAEDLHVVNLLQAQWGKLFSNGEDWIAGPSVQDSPDGRTIVYVSQENRQHLLGHLSLLGLKERISPWATDGASEDVLGGTLETTTSHWADACHEQGGLVVVAHFTLPYTEVAALIATGRADAIEMVAMDPYFHNEYYRYLSAGYPLPLVAGTDKMTGEVPVGIYRTYVHIPNDEPFDFEHWARNIARGRTFVSAGPILRFTANGQMIGDTIHLSEEGGTVHVEAEAESTSLIHTMQLIHNGQIIAEIKEADGTRRLTLNVEVSVAEDSWLAVRVGGPEYYDSPVTCCTWERGIFAHSSPIYVALGDKWEMSNPATYDYMDRMIEGSLEYVRSRGQAASSTSVHHHHGNPDHVEYLVAPLLEAQQALQIRREQAAHPIDNGN